MSKKAGVGALFKTIFPKGRTSLSGEDVGFRNFVV